MPDVPPVPPSPSPRHRARWPWLLLVLVLVAAGGVAVWSRLNTPAGPTPAPQPAAGPLATPACADSDGGLRPDDVYVRGTVTFSAETGAEQTIADTCSDSGQTLTEGWCYEVEAGTNVFSGGTLEYPCPNGCANGACRRAAS